MRLIAFISLLLTLPAIGAKTYTLSLKVQGFWDEHVISGIQVEARSMEGSVIASGTTDAQGQVLFHDLGEKEFIVEVTDTSGIYLTTSLRIMNKKRLDISRTIEVRWSEAEEQRIFDEIDSRYPPDWNDTLKGSDSSSTNYIPSDNEVMASPHGGQKGMAGFIEDHMVYPDDCAFKYIQGKVYVSFIVEKDGQVTHVGVVRGVHASLDAEAVRLVRFLPKWTPGMRDGKPMRSRFRLPLKFSMN